MTTSRRMVRVNELIRRELGEALFRLMNERAFDLSAVTITHVVTSSNLRTARVMVSIRDHQDERPKMMELLRHHRVEMQDRINKNLKLKYTPRLTFELDTSLERGDHVLDILTRMEGAPPEPPPEPDEAPEEPVDVEPPADEEGDEEEESDKSGRSRKGRRS